MKRQPLGHVQGIPGVPPNLGGRQQLDTVFESLLRATLLLEVASLPTLVPRLRLLGILPC